MCKIDKGRMEPQPHLHTSSTVVVLNLICPEILKPGIVQTTYQTIGAFRAKGQETILQNIIIQSTRTVGKTWVRTGNFCSEYAATGEMEPCCEAGVDGEFLSP
jgi:hypothetical protein